MEKNFNILAINILLEESEVLYVSCKMCKKIHARNLIKIINCLDRLTINKEFCNNLKIIFSGNEHYEDVIRKIDDLINSIN